MIYIKTYIQESYYSDFFCLHNVLSHNEHIENIEY